jgi:hypothetical protein
LGLREGGQATCFRGLLVAAFLSCCVWRVRSDLFHRGSTCQPVGHPPGARVRRGKGLEDPSNLCQWPSSCGDLFGDLVLKLAYCRVVGVVAGDVFCG